MYGSGIRPHCTLAKAARQWAYHLQYWSNDQHDNEPMPSDQQTWSQGCQFRSSTSPLFYQRQNRHLVILLKVGSCDVGQSRNRYCIETLYTDAHGLAILHACVHHGIPPTCTGNTCFCRPPGAHFPLNVVVEHWVTIAWGDFNGAQKKTFVLVDGCGEITGFLHYGMA